MVSDIDIKAILDILTQGTGINLTGYRFDMIKQRIVRRMAELQISDPRGYLQLIKDNPSECQALMDEIMINASWFFRDPPVFAFIEHTLLPNMISRKKQLKSKNLRIWSVGCAAGEEAFSIAILIHRALEREPGGFQWQPFIFATDIDANALEKAKIGIYPRESLEFTQLAVLDRYFVSNEKGTKYEICSFIKKMVSFSKHDCTSSRYIAPADSVFGTFDLVLCRNLLVYFSPVLQKDVFKRIYKTITPGGVLILGDCESLPNEIKPEFLVIDFRNKIFQKKF
jgi:chemotaxis protein methyltransferase CheR